MCWSYPREPWKGIGAPEYIRSDNGPEFIAKVIRRWVRDHRIQTIYIDPGCPWQNGYAESFNGRFRQECLNREMLNTLSESRVVFEDWRLYYNHERPHRSLGLQTPAQFAQSQSDQGSGSSRLYLLLTPEPWSRTEQ